MLVAVLGLLSASGLQAQEEEPAPPRVTVEGVVLDEITGSPVAGAAVYLEDENRGALTDSATVVARLLRSPEPDVFEFLWRETGLDRRPCPITVGVTLTGWQPARGLGGWDLPSQVPGALSSHCIWRRGQVISPRVYIDEIPAMTGLDALRNYPTTQIYALEVYSQGAEIRAYTYRFMQRMAEKPRALIALSLWP